MASDAHQCAPGAPPVYVEDRVAQARAVAALRVESAHALLELKRQQLVLRSQEFELQKLVDAHRLHQAQQMARLRHPIRAAAAAG